MKRDVTITVNGERRTAPAEGRTLLAQFLREDLRLTGTHVGCDTTQCGCCVVHLDGAPVKACTVLAQDADGAEVVTIEGAAARSENLSRLQNAFVEHFALQCGFCTPGMIMSAGALLERNPTPTPEEIEHYLEGNICRCTGYRNIVRAILAAAGQPLGAYAEHGHS